MLFQVLASALVATVLPNLYFARSVSILIPSLSICVRRLHDIGKSGWWYLFALLPLVGGILLMVLFCKDSTEANQWGPHPKYGSPQPGDAAKLAASPFLSITLFP